MSTFEVVGYDEDGDPIVVTGGQDIMGDIMGDDDEEMVEGRRRRRKRKGGGLVRVNKAPWRNKQLAPGIQAPQEGVLPLPMSGAGGTTTFTAAINTITFQGVMQKPFRGERFLVSVVRTGASAIGRLIGQVFVGTDLQQADLTGFDMELIGQSNAFGVRLTMTAAQPGVWIRVPVTLSSALAGADTIFVSMLLLGRIEH